MCMEKWYNFFMHLMENLTLGSPHQWGKKPHDPLAQWTLDRKICAFGN